MDQRLFQKFADIAYTQAGIHLKENKIPLLTARINKRMIALGLKNHRDYLRVLSNDRGQEELILFLDAISTNFTSFFREEDHFGYLRDLVKETLEQYPERMRFWSVACSSGEEPYSMCITVKEAIGDRNVDYRILATDISTRVLQKAMRGLYLPDQLEKIPKYLRTRYFEREGSRNDDDALFRVDESIKSHVVFKRLNLAKPPFPMKGPLDAVFCRNVMIYFDKPVKQRLVQELTRLLKPGGLLMIGHSESLAGLDHDLTMAAPSIFVKGE